MSARASAHVTARESRAIVKRAIVEVDVLADLLAMNVRSHAPPSGAARRLERVIEQIPAKFAEVLAPLTRAAGRKTKRREGRSGTGRTRAKSATSSSPGSTS